MKKFRVEERYLMKVWFEKVYECEASEEEDIYEGNYENEKIISDIEIESEHGDWTEVVGIEEIETEEA